MPGMTMQPSASYNQFEKYTAYLNSRGEVVSYQGTGQAPSQAEESVAYRNENPERIQMQSNNQMTGTRKAQSKQGPKQYL